MGVDEMVAAMKIIPAIGAILIPAVEQRRISVFGHTEREDAGHLSI